MHILPDKKAFALHSALENIKEQASQALAKLLAAPFTWNDYLACIAEFEQQEFAARDAADIGRHANLTNIVTASEQERYERESRLADSYHHDISASHEHMNSKSEFEDAVAEHAAVASATPPRSLFGAGKNFVGNDTDRLLDYAMLKLAQITHDDSVEFKISKYSIRSGRTLATYDDKTISVQLTGGRTYYTGTSRLAKEAAKGHRKSLAGFTSMCGLDRATVLIFSFSPVENCDAKNISHTVKFIDQFCAGLKQVIDNNRKFNSARMDERFAKLGLKSEGIGIFAEDSNTAQIVAPVDYFPSKDTVTKNRIKAKIDDAVKKLEAVLNKTGYEPAEIKITLEKSSSIPVFNQSSREQTDIYLYYNINLPTSALEHLHNLGNNQFMAAARTSRTAARAA